MKLSFPHLPPTLILLKEAGRRLFRDDGIELAGFIAYTALVSLFPFVIFLFALAGFLRNQGAADQVIDYLFSLLPREVANTISPIVDQIMANSQPELLTIGIVGTLWVTSSGVEALRMGVNRAYDAKEKRPFWKRRLSSVGIIILGAIGTLAVSLIIIIAPLLQPLVAEQKALPVWLVVGSTVLRFAVAAPLLATLLCFCYWLLPAPHLSKRHCWPGAWLATFLWMILASLFSLYLAHVEDYNVTYGSLGGVVLTLLFLHASAIIFLFGAEYNVALQHKMRRSV